MFIPLKQETISKLLCFYDNINSLLTIKINNLIYGLLIRYTEYY